MEEEKKEKKQIKISLGTAICIFIIILLAALLVGTVIYYNRGQEKNNIAQGENNIATEKEIALDEIAKKVEEKYSTGSNYGLLPEFNDINEADEEWLWFMLKSYAQEQYEDDENKLLTYNEVETLAKEFFGEKFNKEFPKKGVYGFEKQEGKYNFNSYMECSETSYSELAIKNIVKNNNNYEVTIIEYELTYADILRLDEGDEGKVIITNLEGETIKEYDYKLKTIDGITEPVMYDGDKEIDEDYIDKYIIENSDKFTEKKLVVVYDLKTDECYIESCKFIDGVPNREVGEIVENIEEDIVNVEEVYVYSNEINDEESSETSAKFTKIGFSSDGKFLINMEGYFDTVTGQYELIDENIRRCKLEKYFFDEPDGRKTHSLKDKDIYIDFEVVDDKKLKVVANNMSELEGEFAMTMHMIFSIGAKFSKYDKKDFMGEWNTKYVYVRDEDTNYGYRKEEGLTAVFGTSVLGVRSKITFKEDGSFLDYIYPITENDTYRTGTYTFKNGNEITLKYKEGSSLSIYIISEGTLAYHDGNNIMILQK